MPGCSVPHCHRRADKGYRLFVFPKNRKRRQLWAQLCKRDEQSLPKHARICDYHFHDNQFEKYFSGKRGKLKTDAIPTIFDDPVGNKNKESTEVQEDHLFDYTRPEFIDVSQYQDDPLWKSDLNDDSLNMENFLPEEDNLQESNSIVEKLCGEFELPNNIPKSTTVCVDTVNSEYVQATISRTKVLEEQLKKKDKELKATKRLLSKTLKQVKRLKALNEKFRSNSER